MKRIVNFRATFLIAIAVIISIFFALLFAANVSYRLFATVAFITFVIAVFVYSLIFRRKLGTYKVVTFIVAAILSIAAFVNFICTNANWIDSDIDFDILHNISGDVDTISFDFPNDYEIVLDNVMIDGKHVDGKLKIYTKDDKRELGIIKLGYNVVMSNVQLQRRDLIDGFDISASVFRSNIRYVVYGGTVRYFPKKVTGVNKIKQNLNDILVDAMGYKYAGVAFAMITGDKSNLDDSIYDTFGVVGIGHILAVSGLHVGFLVAMIGFLLSLAKCRRWLKILLTSIAMLLYVVIADFSPSALRAFIMCEVGLFAVFGGSRRDILSSLSAAVMLILTLFPFFLFEIGFILSTCSVLGIVIFQMPISRACMKIKLPRKIAQAIALPISTQLGVIPATIYAFNSIQPYALIANIIVVPVISVLFVLLIIFTLLRAVIKLDLFLSIISFCFQAIDLFANFIASLPFARTIVYAGAGIMFCYPIYFIGSRFVMLERGMTFKRIACIIASLAIMVSSIYSEYPHSDYIMTVYAYNRVVSLVRVDGNVYFIGDFNNAVEVERALKHRHESKLDYLMLMNFNESILGEINKLNVKYDFNVVIPITDSISDFDKLRDSSIDFTLIEDASEPINGFKAMFLGSRAIGYTYNGNYSALYLTAKVDLNDTSMSLLPQFDIVRSLNMSDIIRADISVCNFGEKCEGMISCSNSDKYIVLEM